EANNAQHVTCGAHWSRLETFQQREHPGELRFSLPFQRLTAARRQRDLPGSPVLRCLEQLDDTRPRCLESMAARSLPRHAEQAPEIAERRRTAATLDRAQQSRRSLEVHRRLAVECARLLERVGGHDDLVKKQRRLDAVVASYCPMLATIRVHACMVLRCG